MELTATFVRDARRLIDDTDDADYTNPDLPHRTAVRLIVRLAEMLGTMASHAERLQESVEQLTAEKEALRQEESRLRQEESRLRVELDARDDAAAAA